MHLAPRREDNKVPLPKSYYDAFQNIFQDKNQELIVLEKFNKEIIGTLQLTFIPYLTYRGGLSEGSNRSSKNSQEIWEKGFWEEDNSNGQLKEVEKGSSFSSINN